jgi:hypothetical protein
MGIIKNAGRLLVLMYYMSLKKERIHPERILEMMKIPPNELDSVIKYLRDESLIDIILTFGNHNGLQHFIFKRITSEGINLVEDEEEFKDKFKLKLGDIQFKGYC